ncbi:hypothetical protein B9Z19DRAFT_1108389 [Tuber borchii]|uniref:Uncharacterized protein n=1 Tax=Tuber borchii TaxID=42251 RepID=A0A2T6ZS12_TUBBO|nr:hypothetical protein B9Z19DRAFT_1108389 [Tuber borchii]
MIRNLRVDIDGPISPASKKCATDSPTHVEMEEETQHTYVSLPMVNTRAQAHDEEGKKHNRPGDTQIYQLEERENMGVVHLHITPLTPETTHSLLPPKVLAEKAVVASMSFHTIPSFPEKSYGYLDCEWGVADGIKKKLNESLFGGLKLRLRTPGLILSFLGAFSARRKKAKKCKEKGVVDGIELRDRKVQRGWSRPPAISTPAKRDGKRDCLFRISTTTPTPTAPTSTTTSTERTKEKRTDGTIKEFTHNTKFPQFLQRTSLDKDVSTTTATFDESLGWLNSTGAVIESALPLPPPPPPSNPTRRHNHYLSPLVSNSLPPFLPLTFHIHLNNRLRITIPRIVHRLEALYKPTTATPYSSAISPTNTSFRFGFSLGSSRDVNENEDEDMLSGDDEHPPDPMTSKPPHRYRSAAPTPDTAIGHRKFFPPDEDEVPDLSGGGGRLRVIGSISMRSGEAERRGSMNTEAPLLGPP